LHPAIIGLSAYDNITTVWRNHPFPIRSTTSPGYTSQSHNPRAPLFS